MVVLKPMAWNSSGYMRPEGIEKSGDDYVAINGFGHEEWNGNPDRLWKGQRVFHTETTKKLTECGSRGELGIIMTAYHDGIPHALESRPACEQIRKRIWTKSLTRSTLRQRS